MASPRRRSLLVGTMVAAGIGAALAAAAVGTARRRRVPGGGGAAVLSTGPLRVVAICLGLSAVTAAGLLGWKALHDQRQTAAIAAVLTRGNAARAPELMRRYGCAGCHTIPGLPGADGRTGPRLDGLRGQVYLGGVARNTGETLVRWIVDPQSLSPRSAMPVTGITEAEARDVAAWLYAR